MNIFKHQHPSNLISRLFILEYMREITAPIMYAKANRYQKSKMFYTYNMDDSDDRQVDFNYEYCLFIASLHELESFLKLFLPELEAVEETRAVLYQEIIEEKQEEERIAPVDINIMDLALTEINKNSKNGLIL